MKAKAFLFIVVFLKLIFAIAQTNSTFPTLKRFNEVKVQASSLEKPHASVVFKTETELQADSPTTMQIIYFNDNKSGKIERDADYYLKRAKQERTKGIIFTTLALPMIGAGSYLLGGSLRRAILEDYVGEDPASTAVFALAVINGAGLIATGIPFAIKGPICLVESKYYKKKAAEQKTSYEMEPALLNTQGSKMACGLTFKLHF